MSSRAPEKSPDRAGAVFHVVTPNDIVKQAAAVAQGSRFLFVDCNEQGGRPETRVRPLLNRHVMLKHPAGGAVDEIKLSRTDQKGNQKRLAQRSKRTTTTQTPGQHEWSTSPSPTPSPRGRQTRPRSQTTPDKSEPPDALIAARQSYPSPSLSPDRRMDMVWRLWFDAPSDLASTFDIARAHWVESAWNMARRSAAVYESIALHAARKKALTDGVWSEYVAQEARTIRSMAHEVQKHDPRPRPLLPVAIGVLAYLALLDGHVEVALTHLRAMRSLWNEYHFSETQNEWVYVAWLDLRFALHFARPPVLSYYIPQRYRDEDWVGKSAEVVHMSGELALCCAQRCPTADYFDVEAVTSLFTIIFQLYFTNPLFKTAEDVPFGRVYDLQYRLCILRATVFPQSQIGVLTLHTCVELVLTTMQLHVWIVGRYWTPVGQVSRSTLTSRVCDLMQSSSAETIISFWQTSAQLSSLLWVLCCISIWAIEAGLDRHLAPLDTLRLTTRYMSISTLDSFLGALREWPWINDWHQARYVKLWHLLNVSGSSADCSDVLDLPQASQGLMLGGLEFYCG